MLRKIVEPIVKVFTNDNIINTIIVANSIAIFLLLFDGIDTSLRYVLTWVDLVCNVIFFAEIFVKMFFYKKDFYKKYSNIMDILIIVMILGSLFFRDYYLLYNVYIIRMLRILKCGRLIRIIPRYDKILYNIRIVFKTCISLFVTLVVCMFILSILLTILYSDTLPDYFGNPILSAYSVFRLFTIEGWYEIPEMIAQTENIYQAFLTKALFSVIVLVGGIFGMSFITSIVTDELAVDNNDEILRKLEEIEKLLKK